MYEIEFNKNLTRGSPGGWIIFFFFYETCRYLPYEDSLKKNRMVALLMTEISNFTTIEEKNEFMRENDRNGRYTQNRTQKSKFLNVFR